MPSHLPCDPADHLSMKSRKQLCTLSDIADWAGAVAQRLIDERRELSRRRGELHGRLITLTDPAEPLATFSS
jgi:hypothetical protein